MELVFSGNNKELKHQATEIYKAIPNRNSNGFNCNRFVCKLLDCGLSFRNRKRLSEHKQRYHLGRQNNYLCETCGYTTRFAHNLRTHARVHNGDKPYCCINCGNCFASLTQLKAHSNVHDDSTDEESQRPYKCNKCRVSFRSSKVLYHHNKLHSEQKSYACPLCGNVFAQAAGISQHMRWHNEQNKHGFPSKLTIQVLE